MPRQAYGYAVARQDEPNIEDLETEIARLRKELKRREIATRLSRRRSPSGPHGWMSM